MTYDRTDHDAASLRRDIERDVEAIRRHCGWVAEDVKPFNDGLEQLVVGLVTRRKEKLLADAGLVAGLGFKMRNVSAQPATYAAPIRRKLRIDPPAARAGTPRSPDPALPDADYEHILGVMHGMSLMMERSPSTFATLGEEALRDHFLVALNGHYEGDASGETFNRSGKTDILLRHAGQNIFVAECKFWSGAKALLKAVDQLLSYTTWRDTKTAIVLLNRNRKMTAVLAQVDGVMRSHPLNKMALEQRGETEFRYCFRHPDDPEREVCVAVLCFDVPQALGVPDDQA